MSYPQHTLHVYQKPKIGNLFLGRYRTYNYRHQIVSNGWYDTASCTIALSRIQGEIALEQWVGNRVAVYVDNPMSPIWEGLISRITINSGGVTFTRSLDNMFNQVRGIYRAYNTSDNPQIVANANEVTSQAIYGVRHGTFDGYWSYGAVVNVAPRMNAIRGSIIDFVSWPQTSVVVGPGGALVSIEMVGFYHTLEWDEYYNAVSASLTINNYINGVLAGLANGTTFFNNADTSAIQSNTAYAWVNQYDDTASPAWDSLQKVAGPGDGTKFWITGITPTDPITGTRRLYYRSYNSTVEYTTYTHDGLRVRNKWGGLVKPWNVIPDRAIRINDALVGWGGMGDDPRETYINRVQYEADSQRVTWAGGDDLTMEGTMQLQKYIKVYGTRFGVPRQTQWR